MVEFNQMVRTRFAPSPTGFLHVGGAYQALLDFAFARKHKGKFVLRIEDTDPKRKVKGAEEAIYEGLEWLGIIPDESPKQGGPFAPYRQSERRSLYQKYAQILVEKGYAYYCFCSPERLKKVREEQARKHLPPMYDRHCRSLSRKEAERRAKKEPFVIRLKVPENEVIVVKDLIRGEIKFQSRVVDDAILLKSDGFPTYHLAVVVDDHLMKITHVIRGEEWLSSAPKHILLYQYFGWKIPVFVHTPILRNPDRSKLSKRHGHTSLLWYKEQGYLPEALINFLCLLGWSHPEGKEIFSLEEFIKLFDLKDLSPVGPIFDLKKLNWLNGQYIRKLSSEKLWQRLRPFVPKEWDLKKAKKIVPLEQERLTVLSDFPKLADFFFKEKLEYDKDLLVQKGKTVRETKEILSTVNCQLSVVNSEEWNKEKIEKIGRELVEKTGWSARDLFMVLRVAISGKTATPPLFETMEVLGREKTLRRIQSALHYLSNISDPKLVV